MSVDPEAAEVREEEKQQEEEEEKEADMEEQERLDALLQRKKLLQDLGVVDQIHQLLQGRTDAGGVLQDACSSKQTHQRQQTMKVRLNFNVSETENMNTTITCRVCAKLELIWSQFSLVCCWLNDDNFACFSFVSVGLFDTVFPTDKAAAAALHSDFTAGKSHQSNQK